MSTSLFNSFDLVLSKARSVSPIFVFTLVKQCCQSGNCRISMLKINHYKGEREKETTVSIKQCCGAAAI
jgi:hypothetical protein